MKNAYLALHTAVILAGFTGIFGKLITLNEGLLVWYRLLLSSAMLWLALKLFRLSAPMSAAEKFRIARTGLFIGIHWIFFYGSIKYANVSIGVVCYCLTSFFTAVFDPLINKKKFSLTELFLSGLTLLGVSLIFHFDTSYQLGIILGTISSALAALYAIYNERLVKTHDSKFVIHYQLIGGAVGVTILMPAYLYFFPAESLAPGWSNTIYLLILSLFCTVALYILFAEALKKLSSFTVMLSFNLEPLYTIILAFLIFDEGKEVNAAFYAGLFFVTASVVLQSVISDRKRRKLEAQANAHAGGE